MHLPYEEPAPERGRGGRQHAAHTVTCGRSSSRVAGPMPLTSSRSSTVWNGPCCVRYWMIAFASTGPTPLSDSSSDALATLMFTIGVPPTPVDPGAVPPAEVVPAPVLGITTWDPSVRSAARLIDVRSAPFRAPPARFTASITRSPGPNSYTPGSFTHPVTSTITGAPEG